MSETMVPGGLTFTVEHKGDMAIVRCSGRLVAGVTDRLYTEVRQLFPTSKKSSST